MTENLIILRDVGLLGRYTSKASHALVFYLRGSYEPWKIHMVYLSEKNNQKRLIEMVLVKVICIGFHPKAIVNNRSAIKFFGATPETPFFFYEGKKIISTFEVCHLFKSKHQKLIDSNFLLFGELISFNDIIKTYEIEKSSNAARKLAKQTDKHLNPVL